MRLRETINNYQTNTMYSETMGTKTSPPKSLSLWTILVHWAPKMTLTGTSHSGSLKRWSSRFGNFLMWLSLGMKLINANSWAATITPLNHGLLKISLKKVQLRIWTLKSLLSLSPFVCSTILTFALVLFSFLFIHSTESESENDLTPCCCSPCWQVIMN